MFRLLTLATFLVAAVFASVLMQRPAHADCKQSGNDVLCSGSSDLNGFVLRAPHLNFRTIEGSFVTNVDTGLDSGICPLSFPGVALGADATVLNQGTITTSGVCGWVLEVGDRSAITNPGSLLSVGILGFGIVGDDGVTVANTGQIVTTGRLASGIALGSDAVVVNTGGVIATSGVNAAAVDVLSRGTITNTGNISARGDLSDGIRTANDTTVINKTTILASGQHAAGVRMSGGILTLNNSGTISALAETPSLVPDAGVIMQGDTVNASNSGNIVASNVGVNLSATEGLTFTNSGTITAGSGPENAAVLISMPTGKMAALTNTGDINGSNGSAAVRITSGNVQFTNSGNLGGDVLFGPGNDTLEMVGGGTFLDLLDGGAGDDTLVLGNSGVFLGTIRNVETLRVFTASMWTLGGTAVFTKGAGIARGALSVSGGTLTTPQFDVGQDAVLRGNGSIISTVTNRGTVYPGLNDLLLPNSGTIRLGTYGIPGTLRIVGSYVQATTGTLYLRLNYLLTNDQLAVTGPATLSGKLQLQIADNDGYNGPADGAYTLVTASGGLSGAFTTVETNSFFLKATLSQSATTLAAQITRVPYASVALTNAQRQAASFAGTQRFFSHALDSVSTAEEARGILSQMAPEVYPALQNTGLFTLGALRNSLRGKTALAGESWDAWGAYLLHGGDETVSAQSYDIQGGIAGIGTLLPDGTSVGVQIAHTSAKDRFAGSPDRGDVDATFAGVNAAHAWDGVQMEAGFLYGIGDVRVQRAFTLTGSALALSSRPSADLWSVYADAAIDHDIGLLLVTPHMGIAYDRVDLGVADENLHPTLFFTGPLLTAPSTVQSLRGEVGMRAVAREGRVRPYGGFSASWDFLNENRATSVTLVDTPGAGFTIIGQRPNRFNLIIEGGINIAIDDNLTGSVGGRIAANDRFAGHSVVARLLLLW